MPDFTSSLYLGMKHASSELPPWTQLTPGVPSALYETLPARELAQRVAAMQGLEDGFIAGSTIHLYQDLYGLFAKKDIVLFVDDRVYPVSKFGLERMLLNRKPVYNFRHLDAIQLEELIRRKTARHQVPVVITDGWCPQCGRPAPLNVYQSIVQPFNGRIVVDDTQGLGIFGKRNVGEYYGSGGNGILKWMNVNPGCFISITSLAKGFGVPIAAISSAKTFIDEFKSSSLTIECSSPANAVEISAALNALNINRQVGDSRRKKLLKNILFAKENLKKQGINTAGGIFPVQSLSFRTIDEASAAFDRLSSKGIETVMTAGHTDRKDVSFIINCNHSFNDIRELVNSF